jgi:hypothetical protein
VQLFAKMETVVAPQDNSGRLRQAASLKRFDDLADRSST